MVGQLIRPLDKLAREHTERAVETIAEVMNDPFAEDRDRLNAAAQLLDRGHGKPNQAIIQVPANRAQAALLAAMSDDDLLQLAQSAELPRLMSQAQFDAVEDPLLE